MELKISKTQMELANKRLERMAAAIEDVPMIRDVPATAFDKEHLVMLCKVLADDLHKNRAKYFELLTEALPTFKERAKAMCAAPYKPSIWRRIWNKRKRA